MSGAGTDAHVVHVFVSEEGNKADGVALSAQDISEWLSIVSPVEYVKLQFDVSSKQSCFAVRFQRREAAKEVVQNLNGVLLKGCALTFRSATFSPNGTAPSDSSKDGTSSAEACRKPGGVGSAPAAEGRLYVSKLLPLNHKMPNESRMDFELAMYLDRSHSEDEGGEIHRLIHDLNAKQRRLDEAMTAIERTTSAITTVDGQITSLQGRGQPNDHNKSQGNNAASVAGPSSSKLQATSSVGLANLVRNVEPIPFSLCGPRNVVSFITETFGPIEWCHCGMGRQTTTEEEVYSLTLAFMLSEDSEQFMAVFDRSADGPGRRKVPKLEHNATQQDAMRALMTSCWVKGLS